MADFGFWTQVGDFAFWMLVTDFLFWTLVADFVVWTLVADFGHFAWDFKLQHYHLLSFYNLYTFISVARCSLRLPSFCSIQPEIKNITLISNNRVAINIAVLLIHNWICKRGVAPK